jgi:hypothetical protein
VIVFSVFRSFAAYFVCGVRVPAICSVFTIEQQRFVELNIAELRTIGRELTDAQRQRFLQLQQDIVALETQLRIVTYSSSRSSFSIRFIIRFQSMHIMCLRIVICVRCHCVLRIRRRLYACVHRLCMRVCSSVRCFLCTHVLMHVWTYVYATFACVVVRAHSIRFSQNVHSDPAATFAVPRALFHTLPPHLQAHILPNRSLSSSVSNSTSAALSWLTNRSHSGSSSSSSSSSSVSHSNAADTVAVPVTFAAQLSVLAAVRFFLSSTSLYCKRLCASLIDVYMFFDLTRFVQHLSFISLFSSCDSAFFVLIGELCVCMIYVASITCVHQSSTFNRHPRTRSCVESHFRRRTLFPRPT